MQKNTQNLNEHLILTSKSITVNTHRFNLFEVLTILVELFNTVTTKTKSYYGFIGRLDRKILAYTLALHFNYQIVKEQFTKLEFLIQP